VAVRDELTKEKLRWEGEREGEGKQLEEIEEQIREKR